MEYKTMDDINFENKCVFIRVDLNTTIKNNKPLLSPRIKEHTLTIAELALKKAKVVVLAHQGRKAQQDFIGLEGHAKLLKKELKKINSKLDVKFVDDVCGQKAIENIKNLKIGEILLLQNTRFLDCETDFEKTAKCQIVDNLEPLCDIFVLDALSVAHRAHASVIGFKKPLKVAGRVLEKELKALEKFQNENNKPKVLILGGAKIKDSASILEFWLKNNKADYILIGGLIGVVMLVASGKKIPQKIELEDGILEKLQKLYSQYKDKIILAEDVLLNTKPKPKALRLDKLESMSGEIYDIGPKTIEKFSKIILGSKSIIFNGPMGVYEKKGFEKGTKKILQAILKSKGFSIIGGGNSTDAIEKLKLKKEKFGYVSLSGKAFIEYLTEGTLPGIEYLRDSSS
ncbi:MAG: phosphoglycerate kinase [Candidatus Omnitrophica bacterium]|nr:phosphoglycerate kinase [Candidatus Omnitrophota bacterium]